MTLIQNVILLLTQSLAMIKPMSDNNKTRPKPVKTTIAARLRRYLLTGIVVIAPISITIYLTYVFLTFVDTNVGRIIPDTWLSEYYGIKSIPGIGLIAALFFFTIIGWFATNFLGRFIISIYEYILDRMPIIRNIYGAIKQIFETIAASKSSAFREAVMLEYPRKGVYSYLLFVPKKELIFLDMTVEEAVKLVVSAGIITPPTPAEKSKLAKKS